MISSGLSEVEHCPTCRGPMTWRQAYGYPVWTQIAFGLSFIAFLMLFDQLRGKPQLLWGWSILQLGLGAYLVVGRSRARKRVLRCIRCSAALR